MTATMRGVDTEAAVGAGARARGGGHGGLRPAWCDDAVSRFFQGRHGGMKAFARAISAALGAAPPVRIRCTRGRFILTIRDLIVSLDPIIEGPAGAVGHRHKRAERARPAAGQRYKRAERGI